MENLNQNTNSTDYFVIPNPLYDVVFKYLMDDIESAKIILSTLINEKITKLKFEPASHTEKIKVPSPDSEKEIRLFHLDFTATVELKDGSEELIMIELQKANLASDIFRFKRYIRKNFQKKEEEDFVNPKTKAIEKISKPIRLIPIFILNFRIENEINDLMLKTNRIKTGIFKEKQLQKANEFIDNLTYDLWVVQLPNLHNITKDEYENDDYKLKLYLLFNLFDQEAQKAENSHRLLLLRKNFPAFLERIINRLRAANIENPDLEEQMFAEEEYLAELIKRDNEIIWYKEELEKTENALKKAKEKLENKRKLDLQNETKLYNLAKILKKNGLSEDEIHENTSLAKEVLAYL